jgi:hypothetical protein
MEGVRKAMNERNLHEGQWESRRRTTWKNVLKPAYIYKITEGIFCLCFVGSTKTLIKGRSVHYLVNCLLQCCVFGLLMVYLD